MGLKNEFAKHSRRSGQTLIVALIVLGILLVLGLVFLGIINRNINTGSRLQQRSEATDLAEAGIRFAHQQMLNSPLGADWQPNRTPVSANDPDFDLIQPGGPDGLGAYSRQEFERGRALIRIRYAPSRSAVALNQAEAGLRKPGKARNYLMIESIGRPGRIPAGIASDPTFNRERSRAESRKQIAFVSIGLIETARFITNKDNSTRPIEIGVPTESGITYNGSTVNVPTVVGTAGTLLNRNGSQTVREVAYGGSLWANGDLRIHGQVFAHLNAALGDFWGVAGGISGADANSVLRVVREDVDGNGVWQNAETISLANNTSPSLNSRSNAFSTARGVLRDGVGNTDSQGFARSIRRKEPPLITRVDPETGLNRYITLTRDSGRVTATGNGGRFGHGQGVYVNNRSDIQIGRDEDARRDAGSSESVMYDWLNPNNGQNNSGWQGAFYVPRGAYLQLLHDGFVIVRDGRAPDSQKYWRVEDGRLGPRPGGDPDVAADRQPSTLARYRLRKILVGGEPRTYVLNTYSLNRATDRTIDVTGSLSDSDFLNYGMPFNGILYFEGNVRVRGVIPTDEQIQIVSNAIAYIEGSITRGIVSKGDAALPGEPPNPPAGELLTRPSRSMLMIAAKDYVAVNTTQFFGPSPAQALEEANEQSGGVDWNPVRMRTQGGSLRFRTEFLLDPRASGANEFNPSTWRPFASGYREVGPGNDPLATSLMIAHSMEDGAAPTTFFSLDVNLGLANPAYQFETTSWNSATPFYQDLGIPAGSFQPIYGLGSEAWQRFPKFETVAFPLIDSNFTYSNLGLTGGTGASQGRYTLLLQDPSELSWKPESIGSSPTNDYLLARAAINPHDVRIEATIYAEQGSFFVIPGPWFNPNPNDRRDAWESKVQEYQQAPYNLSLSDARNAANQDRLENFGSHPMAPFYGEPLAVRVRVIGSVSENMPPPIAEQGEWMKKWGWMPADLGSSGRTVPASHVRDVPPGYDPLGTRAVPNVTIAYDPMLATGRTTGFRDVANNATLIRYRWDDVNGNNAVEDNEKRPLPPIPRLPVSPTLAYFGDEQ
jgi:hypothetical protein